MSKNTFVVCAKKWDEEEAKQTKKKEKTASKRKENK